MMRRLALLALLSMGAVAPAPIAAWAQPAEPTAAQPTLPTQKLTIISRGVRHEFTVEMAVTDQQQQIGLMFRKDIAADKGMLFDWHVPRDVPMWMENTLIPLDMVFIDETGTVSHIAENAVPQSLAEISSGGKVRGTLELQGGLTEKLDIRVGDKVEGAIFGK